MTDQPHDPTSAPRPEAPPRRRVRRFLFVTAIALAAAFTGALASTAVSAYGFGPRHWHGGGFMRGMLSPADIEERADRMVKHFAIEIDATTEQQDKLRGIVKATVRDLLPLRGQAQSARQQARTLLTQPAVDRTAIEKFRTEQLALADTFSKRVAQALGDAAEVLTPEQRRMVGDHLAERERYGHRWR